MKILLADDEKMVRLGIISMLDELYPCQHVYLEATNGKELVRIAASGHPDLAFVDIKMPLMDGLEAIQKARESSPKTIWMILTGHADFSYAQQALKLNVQDYLLKPVSIEDLGKAMERAMTSADILQTEERHRFSHVVIQAYNGYQTDGEIKEYLNDWFGVYVFFVDTCSEEEKNTISNNIFGRMKTLLEERTSFSEQFALFSLNSGELCAIVHGREDKTTHSLREILNANVFRCTSVVGTRACGLAAAIGDIGKVLAAAPMRSLFCTGQLSLADKFSDLANDENIRCLADLLLDLLEAVSAKNEMMYRRLVNSLIEKQAYHAILNRPDCTASRFLTQAFNIEVGEGFQTIESSLQSYAESMYKNRTKNDSVVEQIKAYIEQHYMEQVSIDTISEMYNLTQSYISRIFHMQTGQKFIDYLTNVRVMNAKKFLAQSNSVTVKQVTEAVGYVSVRYFTKVFKRIVGMSPSEYQKSIFGGDAGKEV